MSVSEWAARGMHIKPHMVLPSARATSQPCLFPVTELPHMQVRLMRPLRMGVRASEGLRASVRDPDALTSPLPVDTPPEVRH